MVPANGKELEAQIREIHQSALQLKAIEGKLKPLYDVNRGDIRFLPELWDYFQKELGHSPKSTERETFIFLFIFLYATMCIYDNKSLPNGWRDAFAVTLKMHKSSVSYTIGTFLIVYSGQKQQERAHQLLCAIIRQIVPGTPLYMSVKERITVLNEVSD